MLYCGRYRGGLDDQMVKQMPRRDERRLGCFLQCRIGGHHQRRYAGIQCGSLTRAPTGVTMG
jgi:hypothetical protein